MEYLLFPCRSLGNLLQFLSPHLQKHPVVLLIQQTENGIGMMLHAGNAKFIKTEHEPHTQHGISQPNTAFLPLSEPCQTHFIYENIT